MYRIYPGHPDANISLDIHFVDVEFHSSCMYDYITVNGGRNLSIYNKLMFEVLFKQLKRRRVGTLISFFFK